VLHHPELQNIEALWRGVDFLLRRLETGPDLVVHLIDISAEEFAADLSRAEDLSETGLYQLLVKRPAELADGGYSLILGTYELDAAAAHAELLGRAAQIAAQAQAPLVAGLSLEAAQLFAQPGAALDQATAVAWQALRELQAASYLGLIAPRFMLRLPYGKRSDPIERFAFEEFDATEGTSSLLWGHPALLVATLLASPDALENGPSELLVDDLSVHHGVDADGDPTALPCTQRLVTTDAATTLAQRGVMAALAHKGQPELRLAGLYAFNGEPLALATHAPRKTASRGRVQDLGFVFKP
jgi:type VI secretion system protein ImpC